MMNVLGEMLTTAFSECYFIFEVVRWFNFEIAGWARVAIKLEDYC